MNMTEEQLQEVRPLLTYTQAVLAQAADKVASAKECIAQLAAMEHTLWPATIGGLLIGLQEHLGIVRKAVLGHPSLAVPDEPPIQLEGIEINVSQDRQA